MSNNKVCQSCGIPLNRDPQGGGTNADGSKSVLYCGYCYVDGKFTYEGNVKDFQEFCRQKMLEGGHNKFTAWLFSRGLKRLSRWKNK
jgi:hypothetical protein